ncbi:MAG: hypothetical protein JJE47_02910 [Acidimicrobiia bacterium]|nr:hypothetical protein [Acidimicrobiia bacterium]
MIVEVIAVGTELLIGQIINSNVAFLGSRLHDEGFDAHFQVTVGDNLDRMTFAIEQALGRADAVILTGGIGPTQDDVTREAICRVTGRAMTRDLEHEEKIRERLMRLRGEVNINTLRMADYPEGAETMENRKGVALGVALDQGGKWIFAMPGVPTEMKVMFDEQVMPRLRASAGEPAILKSRVVRTWGYGESSVAEKLDDLYESSNPSIAFLIDASEVRIRITAKDDDEATVDAMLDRVDAAIVAKLGDAVFGRDDQVIEVVLIDSLSRKNWTFGTIEQFTAGAVGARFANVGPAHFAESIGLRPVRLPEGADTQAAARQLLDAHDCPADVVVAVSGVAGDPSNPNTSRTVGIAVRTPNGVSSRELNILGDDERARQFANTGALHGARLAIEGRW